MVNNTSLAAAGHLLTTYAALHTQSKMATMGPKWLTGSGEVSNPRFLGSPVNFCKISFLIRALLEKVAREEKNNGTN